MSKLKSELRKALIAKRRALSPAQRRESSRRATRHIERLAQFKSGARVAVYESFGSELDVKPLILSARRRGVRLFVPVVVDLERRRMLFVPLDLNPPARARSAGAHRRVAIAARWLDLIVIPVVGVDSSGHRLGMGAGFFDRALAYRRLRRYWRGPLLVAIGFDCQRVAAIGAEPWDARIDAWATESRMEHFATG